MNVLENLKKLKTNLPNGGGSSGTMAERALNSIADGVMIIDATGNIRFINPAAVTMTGSTTAADVLGLSFLGLMKLEDPTGQEVPEHLNPLKTAMQKNEVWSSREYALVTQQGKRVPVALSLTLAGGPEEDKIITFRNIGPELEKENEQTEFISTASHEMRTPVASIEGYLGLALNPQTATIDERARKYLTEAHSASQHLGRLFRDLLDITKLDDNRMKVELRPVEVTAEVKRVTEEHRAKAGEKKLKLFFGMGDAAGVSGTAEKKMEMPLYAMVDMDFLQEVLDNLIENAVKYTPEGGSIWVNVRENEGNAVIVVSDSGIGIAPDDLKHVFQKFYRVDNSDTRTIGGTGLGLYIVKKRVESMHGRVWAESVYGKGSNFYVSLPRISGEEYNRQKQILANLQAMRIVNTPQIEGAVGAGALQASASGSGSAGVVAGPVPAPTLVTPVATSATPVQPTAAPVVGAQTASDLPADQLAAMKAAFAEQAKASQNKTNGV